jgi:hypothetical protein
MKLRQYLIEIEIDKSQFLKKLGDPKKDLEKILMPLRKIKRNPQKIKTLLGWFDEVFKHIDNYEKVLKDKNSSFAQSLNAFERITTSLSFRISDIRNKIKEYDKWPEVKEAARKLFYYWKEKNDALDYLMKVSG